MMRHITVDITASLRERRKMMRYVCTSRPPSTEEVAVKKRLILSRVKLNCASVKA